MHEGRVKSAARGLAITLIAPASIALLQVVLAPAIVQYGGADPSYAWMYVPGFRRTVLEGHIVAGLFVLGYWLAMAAFCRGDMLRIRSANVCLLLSGLLFETCVILGSVRGARSFVSERLCAVLGVSEPSGITYGFDPVSECDLFWATKAGPVFLALPVALLVASALRRIFVSRYRFADMQPASA